ncbi:hypothetical protein BS50DRAFT_450702, partial [Corynespora cassiicola Philippines]
DWSTEEEDNDMNATPMQKTLRIQELTVAKAHHLRRLDKLEADNARYVERIDQLESTAVEKDNLIRQFEDRLKDKRVTELEEDVHAKFLLIQELVAGVDEKDCRIEELEKTLDGKAAHIHELENRMHGSNGTSDSTQKSAKAVSSEDEDSMLDSYVQVPTMASVDATPMTDTTTNDASDSFMSVSSPLESSPAPCNLKEPVFATSETIKKTPPVPPAPKLKLGIDMTKWGKSKAATTKTASKSMNFTMPQRPKTQEVPQIDNTADIRKMPIEARRLFGNGVDVAIAMGSFSEMVPKYMAMQVSEKMNMFFTNNPKATRIDFPTGIMDVDALKAHTQWMRDHTRCNKVFSIQLDYNNDARNFKICRAARVLGINCIYVGHITRQYCERIRSKMQPLDIIAMIDDNSWHEHDPIWECLVNNLANQRFRANLPASINQSLDALLSSRPRMADTIAQIE